MLCVPTVVLITCVALQLQAVWVRAGTHIGKVLVQTAAEEPASSAHPSLLTPAVPQISFRWLHACLMASMATIFCNDTLCIRNSASQH